MRFHNSCYLLASVIFLSMNSARAEVDLAAQHLMQSTSCWKFVGGKWSLEDGRLNQRDSAGQAQAYCHKASLGDTSVQVRFRVQPVGSGVQAPGLILRARDSENAYFVHYDTKNDQIILFRGNLLKDASEILRQRNVVRETDRWYTARASIQADEIRVYLDGRVILTARDKTHAAGLVGVYSSQGSVEFEGLEVSGREAKLPEPWKVIHLTNGWLLAVYGRRRQPFGEYACISQNGGNHEKHEPREKKRQPL